MRTHARYFRLSAPSPTPFIPFATISLAMPSIKSASDLIMAAAALTDATAAGDITPSEAASLSTLVGNVAKAIETVEIVARLERIEEQLGTKGMSP